MYSWRGKLEKKIVLKNLEEIVQQDGVKEEEKNIKKNNCVKIAFCYKETKLKKVVLYENEKK